MVSKKIEAQVTRQGLGLSIWVYKLCELYIDKIPVAKYASINQASLSTGISRGTIVKYLNTNVPLKGLLYYSSSLTAFEKAFEVAKGVVENLNFKLSHSAPIKVWAYNARSLELINGKPFISIGEAARFLGLLLKTIMHFLDNGRAESSTATYFYRKPLTEAEIRKLRALHEEKGNFIFYRVKV